MYRRVCTHKCGGRLLACSLHAFVNFSDVLSYINSKGLEPLPFKSQETVSQSQVVPTMPSNITVQPPKVDDYSCLSTTTQVLQHTEDLTDISLSELSQATAVRLLESKVPILLI